MLKARAVRLVGGLADRAGDDGFDKGAAQDDQTQPAEDRRQSVERPHRGISRRQQGEGQHQGAAEAHPVGDRAGEERHHVDEPAEDAGHRACLHIVQPDDTDQIGAQGDEGAIVGGAFAQFGGVAGPEHAREAPGLGAWIHGCLPTGVGAGARGSEHSNCRNPGCQRRLWLPPQFLMIMTSRYCPTFVCPCDYGRRTLESGPSWWGRDWATGHRPKEGESC